MFCHRCGNEIPDGSVYCNRCGAKMRTQDERLRKPSVTSPPPRPARRYPTLEQRPSARPVEESEEIFDDQVYHSRASARQHDRRNAQVDDRAPKEVNQQGEGIIFRINPTFYPVLVAYIISIISSLLVGAVIAYLQGSYWIVLAFSTVFFIPSIIRHIQLINIVYLLTDVKVEIISGFFSKSSRNIPLRHIQDVFVSETFKERVLGIGDIIIDTAASGSKMTLENIHDPRKYADLILNQLHRFD